MKTLKLKHHGQPFPVKCGRREPSPEAKARLHRFRAIKYVLSGLPVPPPTYDMWTPSADAGLSNVLGNDQYGDCLFAGSYHVLIDWLNNAGNAWLPTTAQVLADYSTVTGFNPSDPSTDNGADEATVYDFYVKTGFADGSKYLGVVSIDATNKVLIQSMISLFSHVGICMNLPDAWTTDAMEQAGAIWDKAGKPDPDQGHFVVATGYDDTGLWIDSWGLKIKLTWSALAYYAIEANGGACLCALSQAIIDKATGTAPNAMDFATLVSDFDAEGGNISPVAPTPPVNPVPPTPKPSPVPNPPIPKPIPPVPVPPTPKPSPVPVPPPITPAPPLNMGTFTVDCDTATVAVSSDITVVHNALGQLLYLPHMTTLFVPRHWTVTTMSSVRGKLGDTSAIAPIINPAVHMADFQANQASYLAIGSLLSSLGLTDPKTLADIQALADSEGFSAAFSLSTFATTQPPGGPPLATWESQTYGIAQTTPPTLAVDPGTDSTTIPAVPYVPPVGPVPSSEPKRHG